MKVAQFTKYGPPEVITIEEVDTPKPKKGQLLVKVIASSVTAADARIRAARFPKGLGFFARLAFGVLKPRVTVLGSTYSGVVEEAGAGVSGYAVGDQVCGMTVIKFGTHAQYIVVNPQKSTTKKPSTISHEEAAGMLFGATAALAFVRDKLHVSAGDAVLINGASGAVGTHAVQLARYYGGDVTAVTSAKNSELVRLLGAKQVIDYNEHDVASLEQRYDVVLDAVGNLHPKTAKKLLKKGGRAGLMVASLSDMVQSRGPIKTGAATEKASDMDVLLSLVQQGDLQTVIDSEYGLDAIVDAHTRADSRHAAGAIIVKNN